LSAGDPRRVADPVPVTGTPETGPAYPWLRRYPKGVDWHQAFDPEPHFRLLDQAVRRHGSAICTNFLGRTSTYREIGQLVNATAAGLQARGIGKGSNVGLFLPNSPTFIIYYFAILKTGATVVNFNPLYTLEELTHQIRDSGVETMITLDLKLLFDKIEALVTAGTLKSVVVASFAALLPGAKSVLFKLLKRSDLARPDASPIAAHVIHDADLRASATQPLQPVIIDPQNDVAVLQYTGGTTGVPKGAMLTHANVYINALQGVSWVPEMKSGQERILGALPFFHVFAMTGVMNFAIAIAAEIVIMPRFVLADALALITKTRPTLMPGVPTMFIAMLNHPKIKSFDLSSLKFCLSGGAPLLLDTKQRFEAISGCKVVEAYGLSEASPAVTCNPLDGPIKELSIGQPFPATIVSLRNPADPSVEVPFGERGELCIKGPQVMKGYWKNPAATAEQFTPDGYLRTGDIATMDDEGFIFIVDRIKDLIICSGYNVYPRNVEEAISTHPAVEEVTVIGIKDAYRGEAPKAFIKLKAGASATRDDILRHLEKKLSRIEMPSEIEFRDALPKTLIGKLSKKELKEEEALRQKGR
jgi:long-chain acyl-CoA synthetase